MQSIEDLRKQINTIDEFLAILFTERMKTVENIALYKQKNNLPVLDEEREKQIISCGTKRISDEKLKKYYAKFLKTSMDISKEYQNEIIERESNTITVKTNDGEYPVYIGKGLLKDAEKCFSLDRKVLILTDSGVPDKYSLAIKDKCKEPFVITIEQGEKSKSFENFKLILSSMLSHEFTRTDAVVAVGGGVVGDLGGFCASVYMRGIDFYNVPTTVLSQVDSSVGGKTAIDFCSYKNIIGAFYPPKAVLIDIDTLKTLPHRQISAGLAESIKMAVTLDKELFELVEKCDIPSNIEEIIRRSIELKKNIVQQDEKESGIRRVLNFGHTIGHAIESSVKENELFHGECVALGMLYMSSDEVKKRLISVLDRINLPINYDFDIDLAVKSVVHDKKFQGEKITVIRCEKAGEFTEKKLTRDEIISLIKNKE